MAKQSKKSTPDHDEVRAAVDAVSGQIMDELQGSVASPSSEIAPPVHTHPRTTRVLWFGVIFFLVCIIIIWLFQTSYVVSHLTTGRSATAGLLDRGQQDWDQTLGLLRDNDEKVKSVSEQFDATVSDISDTVAEAVSSTEAAQEESLAAAAESLSFFDRLRSLLLSEDGSVTSTSSTVANTSSTIFASSTLLTPTSTLSVSTTPES